jgi:streptogramin lyase
MWKGAILTVIAALAAATDTNAEEVIYSTARVGEDLIKIDPDTGRMEVVGSIGIPGSIPIASAPDGTLYTVTDSYSLTSSNAQLAKVDPKTGKTTPIGAPWDKPVGTTALGVAPDGTIYAGGLVGNKLYTIDPATGVPTEIGPFEGGKDIQDFAFHPNSGAMYAVGSATLYRLDPTTAKLTEVAPITNTNPYIEGIEFAPDGTLYATNGGPKSWLYRLDPKTGIGEKIAGLPTTSVRGAAMIVEP